MKRALLILGLLLAAGPAAAQVAQYKNGSGVNTNVAPSTPLPTCPYSVAGACVDISKPLTASSTNGSGSIGAGGTAQVALAANTARKGCLIQNPVTATEPLYVEVGSAAFSAAAASVLNVGATFSCTTPGGLVIDDEIQIEAATTGHAFTMVSQ